MVITLDFFLSFPAAAAALHSQILSFRCSWYADRGTYDRMVRSFAELSSRGSFKTLMSYFAFIP